MPSVPGWLLAAVLVLPPLAPAQETGAGRHGKLEIGVSIGTAAFSGAAGGTGAAGETLRFTPYRPTMYGLQVSWGGEHIRLEGSARYGEPGLALRGVPLEEEAEPLEGLLVVAENAFHLGSFSAGVSAGLGRLRGGPQLRGSVGAVLERWSGPDLPARTLAGVQAGLALEVSLTGALTGRLEGELGVTPGSPFRREDLPEEFLPRTTWRRSLGVGVSWRP